jgi:threonine synthase
MKNNYLSESFLVNSLSGQVTKQDDFLNKSFQMISGGAPFPGNEMMEDKLTEVARSKGTLLCPDVNASYMGLVKLIEKDWVNIEHNFLSDNH